MSGTPLADLQSLGNFEVPRRMQTSVPGGSILFGTLLLAAAPRWEDLAWLRRATELPLLLNGGIRSGTDVVKALALGGSAVLVGRPVFHALAVGCMAGVAHILHMLRVELELTMTQLGCATLDRIDANCLSQGHRARSGA